MWSQPLRNPFIWLNQFHYNDIWPDVVEWASDGGRVAMTSGTSMDWSNDITQSWKTIKWSRLGLLLPFDQMINLKYGKSFSIEMMPHGMCRHWFDVLPHGKHMHPIICCHVANIRQPMTCHHVARLSQCTYPLST
jgi:hypothetical protein